MEPTLDSITQKSTRSYIVRIMTTMIAEVYDALRDAQGVSDEKARKAAEAIAAYDARFGEIKSELAGVKVEMAGVRGEVRNLRWMTGFNLALTVAVLLKLFVH